MEYVCWVIPIKPGQTDKVREYCAEMQGERREAFERSEVELGLIREHFFLWNGPDRDYIILYMDGDIPNALKKWVDHDGAFETWGKQQWTEWSDPEDWPEPRWALPGEAGLPELLCSYDRDNPR